MSFKEKTMKFIDYHPREMPIKLKIIGKDNQMQIGKVYFNKEFKNYKEISK